MSGRPWLAALVVWQLCVICVANYDNPLGLLEFDDFSASFVQPAAFGRALVRSLIMIPNTTPDEPQSMQPGVYMNIKLASSTMCTPQPFHSEPHLLVIPRGGCTFIEKVLHAQASGASSVLFVNTLEAEYSGSNCSFVVAQHQLGCGSVCSYTCEAGSRWIPVSAPSVCRLSFDFRRSFQTFRGPEMRTLVFLAVVRQHVCSQGGLTSRRPRSKCAKALKTT